MKTIEKQALTSQQVLFLATVSVRITGGLDYFWNRLKSLQVTSPSLVEMKNLIVENSNYIFRVARKTKLTDTDTTPYETECFGSREIEGDWLPGFQEKVIDIQPLRDEIPNYGRVIKGQGLHPVRVYLLEYTYIVHAPGVIQPLFKVVAEYRGRSVRQLFIVGRDRYTGDPFALGVPNGYWKLSIQDCLRWTMDLHKGDTVNEV